MRTIGNPQSFAFEILTEDKAAQLVDIFIVVNGHRVSGGNPVFKSSFLGRLERFAILHNKKKREYSFPPMPPEAAFGMFHAVATTDICYEHISLYDMYYYKMPDLDTALDGWYIFVYDSNGGASKSIVCREIDDSDYLLTKGEVFATTVECTAFLSTISELLQFFGMPGIAL